MSASVSGVCARYSSTAPRSAALHLVRAPKAAAPQVGRRFAARFVLCFQHSPRFLTDGRPLARFLHPHQHALHRLSPIHLSPPAPNWRINPDPLKRAGYAERYASQFAHRLDGVVRAFDVGIRHHLAHCFAHVCQSLRHRVMPRRRARCAPDLPTPHRSIQPGMNQWERGARGARGAQGLPPIDRSSPAGEPREPREPQGARDQQQPGSPGGAPGSPGARVTLY
jgi:hypothetical protein